MKILNYLLVLSLFPLASCSNSFTAAQKAQLKTIDVEAPVVTKESYTVPQGHSDVDLGLVSYAGLAGLASRVIKKGVEINQQASFDRQYQDAVVLVKQSVPSMLSKDLKKKTEPAVNSIPQLSGKLDPSSDNKLITNITSYGFKRSGKSGDKILMTPQITGTFSIVSNGETILKPTKIEAQTYANKEGGYEITDYLKNKSLTMKDFESASVQFANTLKSKLESKYK